MVYERILYETRAAVAYLTLNHPQRANALSRRMIAEITHALQGAAADEGTRVIVLRPAGRG